MYVLQWKDTKHEVEFIVLFGKEFEGLIIFMVQLCIFGPSLIDNFRLRISHPKSHYCRRYGTTCGET